MWTKKQGGAGSVDAPAQGHHALEDLAVHMLQNMKSSSQVQVSPKKLTLTFVSDHNDLFDSVAVDGEVTVLETYQKCFEGDKDALHVDEIASFDIENIASDPSRDVVISRAKAGKKKAKEYSCPQVYPNMIYKVRKLSE